MARRPRLSLFEWVRDVVDRRVFTGIYVDWDTCSDFGLLAVLSSGTLIFNVG